MVWPTLILQLSFLLIIGNLIISPVACSPKRIQPSLMTSISSSSSKALFGVRGGAFFGFGRSSKSSQDGGGGGDDDTPKRYPALSQEEIEEKLNIPVFGLTDAAGNGVILAGDNGRNIFHFFFSKHMADAALKAVTDANENAPPLRVSAFHLGKCWFKLIKKSGIQEYKLQKYGGNERSETTKAVHFRLVPDMKDLMGARILTGLNPGDVEKLKDAVQEPDTQKALSIIQQAANSEKSSFNSPFDEIPVFAIAQMRVKKKDENGNGIGENMMPFHLSTRTMSDTWTQFVQHSPQFKDAEATLQLIELHKMIEMMQNDSDFDFRNIVFIYSQYDKDGQNTNDSDDSDDDDDNDGGGGDNGMKVYDNANYDDASIEPFVSMEIFTDNSGSLVQLDS